MGLTPFPLVHMKTKKSSQQDDSKVSAILLALRRMERLAGIHQVVFSSLKTKTGTKTLLTAYNKGTITEAVLNAPIPGLTNAWQFYYPQMATLTQGRSTLDFSFNEGKLVIKGAGYKVECLGEEVAGIQRAVPPENPEHECELTHELWEVMNKSVQKVQLQKSLANLPDMDVHFSFTKARMMVVSYDRYQTAYVTKENTTGLRLELSLPLPTAQSLLKEYLGDMLLRVTPDYLFVQVGNIRSLAPLTAIADEDLTFKAIEPKLQALEGLEMKQSVKIAKENLAEFLVNAKAFSKSSSIVECKAAEDALRFCLKADGNKVTSKVKAKVKGELEFLVDLNYLSSILSKSEDTLTFSVDDSLIRFKSGPLTYIAMLSTR